MGATTWAAQVVARLAAAGPPPLAREVRVALIVEGTADHVTLALGPGGVHAADGDVADLTVRLEASDARALAEGRLTGVEALRSGRVRVRGDAALLVELLGWLSATR